MTSIDDRIHEQNGMMTNPNGESARDYWTRKREVKAKYDALSSAYEEVYRDEQLKKYQGILSNLQNRPRRVCVDIGCGTGFGLEACSRVFNQIWVGIDLSKGMLNETRRRIRRGEEWHLILADCDFSPLRSRCADLAICVTLLSKTLRPERTLRELRRLMDSGGEVVVTALKKEFREQEIRELIRETGLKIRKAEDDSEVKDYTFFCSVD